VKRRTVNGTASSYFAAASVFLMLISLERSVYPILLAAAVLFHELGHVAMAYLVGASISGAGSGLYRLCLYYDPARLSYRKEAWICAGGVIFNLILAALSTLFLPGDRAAFFLVSNLTSAAFNLIPLRVLDGGGLLRCFLLSCLPAERAEAWSRGISLFFTVFLFICSVYLQLSLGGSLSLFALSVYMIADTALGE